MVEDGIQDLNSSTCVIFQFYFFDNLFNPDENSKIQRDTSFIKRTVEALLNELFFLDNQNSNEKKKEQYTTENRITIY